MKKCLALIMAIVMCVSLLAGCGGDNKPKEVDNPDNGKTNTSADMDPKILGELYDTGEFRALVPEGWRAFPISDVFADTPDTMDTSCFNIIKGGESDLDLFSKPYVRLDYYGPDTMMMEPSSEWYENVEDVAPMQLGKHTWSGFTGEDGYGKMAVLWAEEGNIQYQATIWLEVGDMKISLEDAEVQAILASVEPSDGTVSSENASGGSDTVPADNFDWWKGSWYGWWCIRNGTGIYEPASDIAWDAYAEIEVNNDNTGLFKLWDTGTSRDEILVYGYDITFEPGASDKGRFVSTRVEFFPHGTWNNGMEADTMTDRTNGWTVDPADSSVSHFENMLEITGHYESPENPEDCFDYYIYLRPWGTLWDDVRNGDTSGCIYSDMMPIYHDNWYISLLNLGYGAPTASFQDGITVINDYLAGNTGSLDPADKADADGIVPIQTLKDVLQWCKSDTDYNTTYDEVAAKFGVHGKLIRDDGDYRCYRWLADEDNYIQITFSVSDGQEYWNVTQWNGLK